MSESKHEKFNYHNNLSGLVKAIENRFTTIDLRNESCVTGKITSVDGFMNIQLSQVIFYDPRGNEKVFDIFFIHNRNIRYIHMPKGTTCKELLENQLGAMQIRPKVDKKRYNHMQRARKYQKEILTEIASKPQD